MNSPRTHRSSSQAIAHLLLLYAIVAGSYFVLRFAGRWSDSDTAALTAATTAVMEEGTLQPSRSGYSMGFAYPSVSLVVASIAGTRLTDLQFLLYPVIAAILILPAYALYNALTGDALAGALAALFLFLQPDFLFVIFRGSHEKVTWLGAIVALFALAKSFAARQSSRFVAYVGLFYLAAFTLIASNVFFGSSFILAVFISLVAGLVLLRLWRRQPGEHSRSMINRLAYVTTAAMVLWFLMVFYLYPPATHFLKEIARTTDRAATVALGMEPRYDPYSAVQSGWISRGAYLGVTSPTWIIALLSFLIWTQTGVRLLRERQPPELAGQFLLWLLYGGFGAQLVLSLLFAMAGGPIGNLQVRLFPAMMLLASPLVSSYLTRFWHARKPGWTRTIWAVIFCLLTAWPSAASLLKATNEPWLASYWNFWTPQEEQMVQWVENHARYVSVWFGPSVIRTFARAVAAGFGARTHNIADSTLVEVNTRDLMLSDMDQALSQRTGQPLVDVRYENRVYDNGTVAHYHLRPRTPYQR
ncbi:MAG: hypothetical protein ACP5Q1_08855 [Anaerolineae bacterium]